MALTGFFRASVPPLLAVAAAILLLPAPAIGAENNWGATGAAEVEFFEKRIRPIFATHCLSCHGETKQRGNLRLDSPSGWLAGGDSGPAIVPGKPDESLLVRAIRHVGDPQMPPSGQLPPDKIQSIAEWVSRGAQAPATDTLPNEKPKPLDVESGRSFWSYLPPVGAEMPAWTPSISRQAIDRWILNGLARAGLAQNTEADRATTARRLYFDLLGLPPSIDELDRFLEDVSPDAHERLVDRLLVSPHFGERWGRHWLDVVRFGESLTLRGIVLPEAWRYRDYVVQQFQADVPLAQFLAEQIAGDLMPAADLDESQRRLIATTFLALGNTNLEEQDKRQLDMDVVDEQLDVIGKAILGQTITCARCHDHKFDPIPTRDYYALAGILRNAQLLEHANVSKWVETRLPLSPGELARWDEQESALAALEKQVVEARKAVAAASRGSLAADTAIVAVGELPGIVVDDQDAKRVGAWQASQFHPRYIGDGYSHDMDQDKGKKTLTFAPELPRSGRYEIRLAYVAGGNRAASVPVTVFTADGEKTMRVNMREEPPIDGRFVSLGNFRCEKTGQTFVLVANDGTTGHVIADAVQFLPLDGDSTPSRGLPGNAPNGSPAVAAPDRPPSDLAARQAELKELEAELARQRQQPPKRPATMTVRERSPITDSPIHIRGSVHTLGEVVPRGFLQVTSRESPPLLASTQSGRRELADWIVSPRNPLTARVYANRVWHWLLGAGLVRTVDNFGTTGEAPSHPELLDHLALWFAAHGESTQSLVRYIVTSRTYRAASTEGEQGLRIDPENRWLWRAHRRRLEAEEIRDAMLAVAGRLDRRMGGATIKPGVQADYGYIDDDSRRSIYVPVLRNALPELFDVFDFADPSLVVGRRDVSTVAPQALFMLNHAFVRAQSLAAARRLLAEAPATQGRPLDVRGTDAALIATAFRQTLGRLPTEAERLLAERLLRDEPETRSGGPIAESAGGSSDSRTAAWGRLYHLLIASLDFRYRD